MSVFAAKVYSLGLEELGQKERILGDQFRGKLLSPLQNEHSMK